MTTIEISNSTKNAAAEITATPAWLSPEFVARCAAAGTLPTRRQLSKARNGYGLVANHERRAKNAA